MANKQSAKAIKSLAAVQVEEVKPAILEAAIDEGSASEKAASKGRKAAPRIKVTDPHHDYRKAQLDDLDEQYPERVHSYASKDVTDWELEAKGQVVARDKDDRIPHHKEDPVVWQPRPEYENDKYQEGKRAQDRVEAAVKAERSTVFRSEKKKTG